MLRSLFINSELTRFQAKSADHVAFNPIIRAKEHSFLEYDSYIGGDHVSHEHDLESVQREIARDPSCLLGHLSDAAKDTVRAIFRKSNPHIAGKHLRSLRDAWEL